MSSQKVLQEPWPYCLSFLFSCGRRTEVWELRALCSSTSFPPLTCSCQSLCSEAKVPRCIFPDSSCGRGKGVGAYTWSKCTQAPQHAHAYTHAHLPEALKSKVAKTRFRDSFPFFKELLGAQKGLRECAPLYLIAFSQVKQSHTSMQLCSWVFKLEFWCQMRWFPSKIYVAIA